MMVSFYWNCKLFWLDYRDQLDSLTKLKWPSLTCESVPWALHTPLCNLDGWVPMGPAANQPASSPVVGAGQGQEPNVGADGRSGTTKEDLETVREDGELPSLIAAASVASDAKLNASKESNVDSRQLTLISKSIISPISKAKSLSFKKHEDDTDFMLDDDSDADEPVRTELETDDVAYLTDARTENSWLYYGVREYCLVLTRKMGAKEPSVKLEAKVSGFLSFFSLSFSFMYRPA